MRRLHMRRALACLPFILFALRPARPPAQPAPALGGQVTSAEEGAMEGVLVSAKRAGSNMTITVVSDEKGRYSFPAAARAGQVRDPHPRRRLRPRRPRDARSLAQDAPPPT